MQLPTAFNLPVELHLRNGVKDLLKARQTKRKGTVKKAPSLGFDNRISVQAQSKYSVVEDANKMEGKYNKALRVDKSDFFAGGKARDLGRLALSRAHCCRAFSSMRILLQICAKCGPRDSVP